MSWRGVGASGGRVTGPVVVLRPSRSERVDDPVVALEVVAAELHQLARETTSPVRDILTAQAAMAGDPELAHAVERHREEAVGSAAAIDLALRPFRTALASARSEYQRQRVGDLDEILRRAVAVMTGTHRRDRHPPMPGILVGETLSPADTALIPRGELLGLVSGDGGDLSHAAILARTVGVPAVLGVGEQVAELNPGDWVAVDGDRGIVVRVRPPLNSSCVPSARAHGDALPKTTPLTADGVPITVLANVGSVDDARSGAQAGAQGAGLVRTEFVFADRVAAPSIEEQVRVYDELLEPLAGPVTVRVIDCGSDKPLTYVEHEPGPNPALGERGLRLLLRHPSLLVDQVRALCRSRHAERMKVLLPMVSRVEELAAARDLLAPVLAEEGSALPLGAMIEVPAAALSARALAAHADFLSLGTNDLLQYLFAIDRSSARTRDIVEPLPAAVWSLLASVFDAARAADIEAGVCGELAADPHASGVLWSLGAASLSVSPSRMAGLTDALAQHTQAGWHALAQAALTSDGHPQALT